MSLPVLHHQTVACLLNVLNYTTECCMLIVQCLCLLCLLKGEVLKCLTLMDGWIDWMDGFMDFINPRGKFVYYSSPISARARILENQI